ncbi:MAG: hypothetical protein LQ346_006756 [Caloplaca aetnensis]|nr:MAG: hypothetical protein LQ346_006756 [Caloplaca aetnensis]
MRNALPKLKEQVRFPNPAFLASATASTARVPTFPHKVFVILITPGADILYLRFGREIESFSDNLKQLEAVVNQTNRQRPRRTWRNPDDECRLALQPVSQAVGDFRKTLEECEKLLNDHERFRRDEAGFVDNVVWHLSTQRDVDILRERVQFHTTKLLVVTKPFEMSVPSCRLFCTDDMLTYCRLLLLEIRQELQDLRKDVSGIKSLLDSLLSAGDPSSNPSSTPSDSSWEIPDEVNTKFLASIYLGAPENFHHLPDLPLQEAFDAVVFHFSKVVNRSSSPIQTRAYMAIQSTVQFNPGFDPSQRTPEETQYINLLKSKWILDKLEGSCHLTAVGTAPLWASALREIKSDMIKEFKRFHANELVPPPQDVVARLPDKCFSIWVVKAPALLPPDLAEERPLESQPLPDPVGTRRSSLHVFQRSPIELRLVTTTRDTMNPSYHQEKGMFSLTCWRRADGCTDFIVNTDITRVIPAYATPGGDPGSQNILLSNRHVQDLRKNVSWAINSSLKPEKSGAATLQMWQLQSLAVPTTPPSSATPTSPAQSSFPTTSPRSFSQSTQSTAGSDAWTARSKIASTSPTLLSGSSATSVMLGLSGNGTAIKTPEPPVIVLLTKLNNKYTFLHFELTDRIYVNPERCYCRQNSKKPCQIVIIETKSKTIHLRRFQAAQEAEKGLHTWDLARLRFPRHPQFKELEVVKKVEYITLTFDSVTAKDEFRHELKLLEQLRNLDHKICQDILEEKRARDRKPAKR